MINRSKPIFVALAFLLCYLLTATSAQDSGLPQEIIDWGKDKMQRTHHLFWHITRALYAQQDADLQHEVAKLAWNPLRPSVAFNPDGSGYGIKENDSGQDFLWKHRRIMREADEIAEKAGVSWRTGGWDRVPAPGDENDPVPPAYTVEGNDELNAYIKDVKTDEYYNNFIKTWEDKVRDEDYLKSVTLGELGAEIEHGIHLAMFYRFSKECAAGYRPNTTYIYAEVDDKYNDESYNWVTDPYSTQLDPIYYKIYGWIDDRTEDWRKANGIDVLQWSASWGGGPKETIETLWSLGPSDDADDT